MPHPGDVLDCGNPGLDAFSRRSQGDDVMSIVSRAARLLAVLTFQLALAVSPHAAFAQVAPADSVTPPPAPAATPPAPEAPVPDTTAAAPAQAPAPAAAGTIRADAPADTTAPDGGWPRLIEAPSGASIILYQPQVVSWKDQKQIVAMCAVSYTPRGAAKPDLGTVRLESATSTSVETRMVNFVKVELTSMTFPSLEKLETQEVLTEIKKSLPKENVLIALDRIMAAMDTSMISTKGIKINTAPPPIFYSTKPAILVQFDGEPIMVPVEKTSLRFVVNTNWDVFQDTDSKLYILRNDTYWLQSPDLTAWEPVEKLPVGFETVAKDDNWTDLKPNIPGKKISKGKMPVVFVSKTPAELILLDGGPKKQKIENTKLTWIKNTESDYFLYEGKKKDEYFVLLSGRWFKTEDAARGPWVFATADLPPDFANIPRGHERARVLSSVPGTEEAMQAILLASIPTTAKVDAKALKAPEVKYDGDPKFKPIAGATGVACAENSPFDVLQVGDRYYLCYQGVWFASKSPTGPFEVTTVIPTEIYSIPASSPAHYVTYVTVVDDDPDYPTYGYTAGYVGVSIAFGCAMWGSGYYYPPYYHYGGGYYPRPVAYGCGATYNPWTGAYGGYQAAYGPYGGAVRGASYNPSTGTYKRGAVAYGPNGAKGYAQAYNPRTGTAASTRQGSNAYGSWGSTSVKRGDDWVNTQRVTDSQGNTKWKAQGSGGGSATGVRGDNGSGFVGQSGNGDVYAGKDGNVYRKTDGGWQSWDKGNGWSDAGAGAGGGNRPSQQPSTGAGSGARPSTQPSQPSAGTRPSTGQLDRDAQARSQGAQRTQDYGNYQRGGSSSGNRGGSSASTRGSSSGSRGGSRGGGSRGGGGRRR
jgi:hypothetical protein